MGSFNIVLISFKKETEMEDDRDGPLQLILVKIILTFKDEQYVLRGDLIDFGMIFFSFNAA